MAEISKAEAGVETKSSADDWYVGVVANVIAIETTSPRITEQIIKIRF